MVVMPTCLGIQNDRNSMMWDGESFLHIKIRKPSIGIAEGLYKLCSTVANNERQVSMTIRESSFGMSYDRFRLICRTFLPVLKVGHGYWPQF